MEDFLRFADWEGVHAEAATREQVGGYVRDLLARTNPRQLKVGHLESGAGLSNATVLLRLPVVRLFYDHLVVDGLRRIDPVGRMHWRKRYERGADGTARRSLRVSAAGILCAHRVPPTW